MRARRVFRHRLVAAGSAAAVLCATMRAPADPPPADTSAPAQDEATAKGRQAYLRGVAFAGAEQWGEALSSFEEAAAARDDPLIQYNIAYCERALGHYIASRRTLQRVLRDPAGLAPSQIEESRAYLADFEALLVRVDVVLDPPSAALTVDGRPLSAEDGAPDTFLGGVGDAAAARPIDRPRFVVLLDPGVHIFRAVRAGHQDAVIRKAYRAGDRAALDLRLDMLPATVAIRSDPESTIVRVDGREVGLAPIEFQREPGTYKLEIVRDHYEPYRATLDLHAGQRADLTAKLNAHEEPLTRKWWFWTGVAAVVASGAALTYALTRPAPQPPPYETGTANWLAHAQSVRW